MPHRFTHLIPSKRALCAASALACFVAAFVLAPSSARSQFAPPAAAATRTAVAPRIVPETYITPDRDAFAPEVPVNDDTVPVRSALVPPAPAGRVSLGTTRSNTALRATAIITGAQPTAIVENGGVTQTVSTGDPLAGSRVTEISAGGIDLADGRHVLLVPDSAGP